MPRRSEPNPLAPVPEMTAFIDEHREVYGVEPICRVLPIAPSTYHERVAQRRDPGRLSDRAQRDRDLKPEVVRVFAENFGVYGVRKVWRQMNREGFGVARCTIERLMRDLGLQGVIRGKPVRTTISDKASPCPLDQVNRQFHAPAPNMLWVSDFTLAFARAGSMSRHGQASFMWPSSSTFMPATSWAGGSAGQRMPASSSMPSSRPSTIADLFIVAGWSTTAIVAANMCRSNIRQYPARRSRRAILRHAGRRLHGRVT